jgi:non-ribosomal peptide synthetase component F
LIEAPAEAQLLAVAGASDRFALDLRATTAESTLLELAYDQAAYSEDDARRIVASFVTLLEHALEEPAATVGSLPLLDETELQRIVGTWNQTSAEIPTTCVHLMVEQHAVSTPERDAVEAGPTKLSYAELNMRANQVAHDLRAAGVNRRLTR